MIHATQIAAMLKEMPSHFRDVQSLKNEVHFKTHDYRDRFTIKLNPSNRILGKLDGSVDKYKNSILAGFTLGSQCVKILVADDFYLKYRNYHRHGKQLMHGVIALFNNTGNYNIDSVKYNPTDKKVVFITKRKFTSTDDLIDSLGPITRENTILYELQRSVNDFRFIMRNIQSYVD